MIWLPDTVTGVRPSYANGFAPRNGPPANPGLWQQVRGLWAPSLGPTGLVLRDQSGWHNHGTLTNMDPATDWVMTEKGWTLKLDANLDRIALPLSAYNLGIRRHATFAATCFVDNLDAARHLISDYSDPNGFTIRIDPDGAVIFYVYPNNHRITYNGGLKPSIGEWFHIAGVMDGASMYLYLNGRNVATAGLGEDIGSSVSPIAIGQRGDLFNEASRGWSGNIANVLIDSRPLAPSEIQQLYTDPNAMFRLQSRVPVSTGAAPSFVPYPYPSHELTGGMAI